MSQFTVESVALEVEDGAYTGDWFVELVYEVEHHPNIQVIGVWAKDRDGEDQDYTGYLSPAQALAVARAAREDYDWRCREAEAAWEDYRAEQAEARREMALEFQQEELRVRSNQRAQEEQMSVLYRVQEGMWHE